MSVARVIPLAPLAPLPSTVKAASVKASPAKGFPAKVSPLQELLPSGRLVEISGQNSASRMSLAVSFVAHIQKLGPVAWIQPEHGGLFPPDLSQAGVLLDSLVVVQVPRRPDRYDLIRAAELLLRSGSFELVVVDLTEGVPRGSAARWQSRLQGLVRQHRSRCCLLSQNDSQDPSLGPLIGVRIVPERMQRADGSFQMFPRVIKDKVGLEHPHLAIESQAPPGLSQATRELS